jgi:hypothetical protein
MISPELQEDDKNEEGNMTCHMMWFYSSGAYIF